ncbi:MAG: ATP-binding protein [Thiobacillaceae bacterium]|nr:ATP-binding protein [Thiobacillaceae bacterium]MDW8324459.1 ATP-binding protein [Burkholderiales bacterium]
MGVKAPWRQPWPYLLTAAILWALFALWMRYEHDFRQGQEFARELDVLDTAYRAAIEQHRLMAEVLFDASVRQPQTLATIAQGALAAETGRHAEAARLRGRLYRQLAPVYDRLLGMGVRQLQIFTPQGRSFLRLHQPDKYGDLLINVRPSVRQVIERQVTVSGFEVGRLFSGFRFVFPLLQEGRLIGAGETSLGFKSLHATLQRIAASREYELILARSTVQAVLWRERQGLYGPTAFSAEYWVEDPKQELPDTAPRSPMQQALNARLADEPDLADQLRAGKRFARAVEHAGRWWVVAFLPIADTAGQHAGYLIGYAPVDSLAALYRVYLWQVSAAAVVMLLLALAAWRLALMQVRLAAEREQLHIITQTMGDALYLSDAEGRVRFVNPAFVELLGWQPQQVLGRPGHPIFHQEPGKAEQTHCPILDTVAGGRRYLGEQIFYRADGSALPVEVVSAPVQQAGRHLGSVTVFRDITRRREAEEALVAAKEAAEAAVRTKSEFLANMSHEIRTPLNGIIGMAELLLDAPLPPQQRVQVETLRASAVSLLGILNDILDLSKIEAGAMAICPAPFDPRALIEDVCRLFLPMAVNKGLNVRVVIAPGAAEALPPALLGDALRIRQVLSNLLGNAVKFTEHGGIEVVAGWSDDRLRIEVRDTGIGIPAEVQTRLFTPFSQADGSTTRRYGGTGLGLALSKRLVELMRGRIGVLSESGHGSTFWFELPCPLSATPSPEQTVERPRTRAAHILLAEDNAVNRQVAEALLCRLGHTVVTAEDGEQAVQAWQSGQFDLVLMDCMMPRMDGYAATRAIRALEAQRGGHTPILALTANVLEDERERCRDAGMDDHLAKPITRAALEQALARWLPAHDSNPTRGVLPEVST